MYWKTKTFSNVEKRDHWIEKNKSKHQIVIIFINNGYGVEYKPLIIIDIP